VTDREVFCNLERPHGSTDREYDFIVDPAAISMTTPATIGSADRRDKKFPKMDESKGAFYASLIKHTKAGMICRALLDQPGVRHGENLRMTPYVTKTWVDRPIHGLQPLVPQEPL
jgi:hypothetical protein